MPWGTRERKGVAGVGWEAEDRHGLTRSTVLCPLSNLHCASLSMPRSRPANWLSPHPLSLLPLSLQLPRCPSSQTLLCHLALKNSGSPVYLFTPVVPQDPFSLDGSMGTKREFFSFTNSFIFFLPPTKTWIWIQVFPFHKCMHAQPLSCVWLLAAPWTITHQAPLFMWFSRQEYWSGLIFLTQGSNSCLMCVCLLHWQVDSLPSCHLGSPVSWLWGGYRWWLQPWN